MPRSERPDTLLLPDGNKGQQRVQGRSVTLLGKANLNHQNAWKITAVHDSGCDRADGGDAPANTTMASTVAQSVEVDGKFARGRQRDGEAGV